MSAVCTLRYGTLLLLYTVFYSQILNNFTMVMANSKAFAHFGQ